MAEATDGAAPGRELMVQVRSRSPDTRLILMSANADLQSAAAAVDHGIDQLVLKPFELDEMRGHVVAAFEQSIRHLSAQYKRFSDEETAREGSFVPPVGT